MHGGASATVQAENIKKKLQLVDSSSWPRPAQKELERFVFSAMSVGSPVITASGFATLRRPLCSSVRNDDALKL
jgi:hypothetical protein